MVADGPVVLDPGAAAGAGGPARLAGKAPALAWAPLTVPDRPACAYAAWEPAKVSSVTLTAATTHTVTAAAAIAAPGWARMLAHLTCLIARANLANHIDSARRATLRRYATAPLAGEVQRLRTCSRSSGGSGANGSRRKKAAGRSVPHL
jgi:hypothetical protein